MKRFMAIAAAGGLLAICWLGLAAPLAAAGGDHKGGHMGEGMMPRTLDEMRELHGGHQHGHDFDAMEEMTPEKRARVMALMHEIGVAMPPMDPARGRQLFVQKGCVACHSVNGVGGDLGPALNAADMPNPMNAFEFAARMWRGAQAMMLLQEDLLGEVISLDGQDLADLVAFAHDGEEQAKLTKDQIPERYHGLIGE
jgi:mono/diheme cytochrome c family protein